MKRFTFILLPLLLLLSVGCHHRPNNASTIDSIPLLTPDFEYLQSTFTCTIFDHQANGQLRIHSDSIIWISINKFIELARVQFTPDSIHLYTKFNNAYYHGSYTDIQQQFAFYTDFFSLQNLILNALQTEPPAFIFPIRSNIINTYLSIQLNRITYPKQLNFPFRIPNSAHPWELPNIQ